MNRLIAIVGASGVGKTTLVQALARTGQFATALEEHRERPFQALFKQAATYALANQIDYLLLRAEQERTLRAASQPGLMDGGLDLDFHGFTRLFHSRGLLSEAEYELCARLYHFIRGHLPGPELIVQLVADPATVNARLAQRNRINIATPEDFAPFNTFVDEWLAGLPAGQVLTLDVSREPPGYEISTARLLQQLEHMRAAG